MNKTTNPRITAYVALRDLSTYVNSAQQRNAQVEALIARLQREMI